MLYAYVLKKNYIVIILVTFVCCSVGCLLHSEKNAQENCTEMDALSTYSISCGGKTIQNISVVTNAEILDCTECTQEIIQHCIDNDFHTIQFSYDVHGYPVEVNARVYETEADWKNGNSIFSFSCLQESDTYEYNIVENLDKFEIVITEN